MNLLSLAQNIESHDNVDAIWVAMRKGLAPHGVDHVIYVTVDADFTNPFLLTTLPALSDDEEPADDPFLHWCCNSYELTLTGAEFLDMNTYLPERDRTYILARRKFGFISGLGIPVRLTGSGRFGGFNLGTGLHRNAFRERIFPKLNDLRLLCLVAHRRIEEVTTDEHPVVSDFRALMVAPDGISDKLDQLAPREREVLFLIAQGLSRKECAQMCQISVNTVSEYIKAAYRKVGLRNRAEAAALLAQRGKEFSQS